MWHISSSFVSPAIKFLSDECELVKICEEMLKEVLNHSDDLIIVNHSYKQYEVKDGVLVVEDMAGDHRWLSNEG